MVQVTVDFPESFFDDLAASSEMRDTLDEVAGELASAIRSNAPSRTGRYRSSVRKMGPERQGAGWVGVVGVNDFAWHMVEWGSVNNPAYAPIRKACHQLGLQPVDL